jgi:hypothetical protein
MTDPISGKPIPRDLQQTYKSEFGRAVKLFEKSLKEYEATTDNDAKKAKFKDVMDKALVIMNESARGFMNEHEQKKEAQVAQDYQAFIAADGSDHADKLKKLQQDLRHMEGYA